MRALLKSLLAELFPRWVKKEVIQHRPGIDPRRRMASLQKPPPDKSTSFGKRSSYRAVETGKRKDRAPSGPGARA